MRKSRRKVCAIEALEPIHLLSGLGMSGLMGPTATEVQTLPSSLSLLGGGRGAWAASQSKVSSSMTDPNMDDGQMDMPSSHHMMGASLVPTEQATSIAVQDGPWSSPETWMDGRVPGAGARVWIMPDRTVTVDTTIDQAAQWVRVSGTLQFAPNHDTALRADTVVVDMDGSFVMGTADAPIQPDVQARLIITGDGPIDRTTDPQMLGRGLIVDGMISVHGAEETDWLSLARFPKAGDSTLVLSQVPVGWKAGDTLVLAGTTYTGQSGDQDEVLTIAGISGTTVQLTTRLRFDHVAPTMAELASQYGQAPSGTPLEVHVAHLTRNARFESETPGVIESRGHVMIMSPHAEFVNAGFYGLGRTDKSKLISPDNPRARYALHFHRVGPDTDPIEVRGCVVDGSPGWGIDNHSSNVNVEDCVVYNVVGSAFTSEAGDERGSFRNNIAIHSTGSTNDGPVLYDNPTRHAIGDFGFAGHGFWIESPQVALSGNVVAGAANAAYIYYPLDFEGLGNNPQKLAITEFRDNTAYASRMGVWFWTSNPTVGTNQVQDFTAWGLYGAAFGADYSRHFDVSGGRFIGNPTTDAVLIDNGQDFSFQGNYVVGYRRGLTAGFGPENVIQGNYLNNQAADILVQKNANVDNALAGLRRVDINGNQILGGGVRLDASPIRPGDPIFWTWFAPEQITWDGRQLYYNEQSPGYVVHGTGMAALDGKTNAVLARDFGLAIAGAITPADAVAIPGLTGGLAGSPVASPSDYLSPYLPAATYRQNDGNYTLMLWDTINRKYATFTNVPASELQNGLNLIRRVKDGKVVSGFATR